MDAARPDDIPASTDAPALSDAGGSDESAAAAAPAEAPSELDLLRREVTELRDKNLRLIADARNQQQRHQREKAEALRFAESEFARELLVVLDDLERTQQSISGGAEATVIADGVRIVCEHFLKVLRGRGIEPIEALGKSFDPHLHEALCQQPSAEYAAGTVMQELARGYRMHERVLRPSRVVVSSGPVVAPAACPDADAEVK